MAKILSAKPKKQPAKHGFFRPISIVIIAILIFLVGGVALLRTWYSNNLRPVSSVSTSSYFTVSPGASVHVIAGDLKRQNLIRDSKAFETYVRSNEVSDKLQKGTYILSPSMSVSSIVRKMVTGDVAKNLLTILPGKRLDEIKQAFTKSGYSAQDVDDAFNPANYLNHPALTSLPRGASLEGYLYPDSFQKQTDTPATTIVSESLDEMNKHLSAAITAAFASQGLNTYQGITLASIVAQETDNPAYQPTVAQVFLTRFKQNMSLGSDVTAFYGSGIAGKGKDVTFESPYNTRIHTGLPPGPIGNITDSALRSVAHPANTDFIYFVAGDDKKIYFSHTQAEHEQAIKDHCSKSCG